MEGKDSVVWPKGKEFDSTKETIPPDILAEVKAGSKAVTVLPDAQALAAEANELTQLKAKYEALVTLNQELEANTRDLIESREALLKKVENYEAQISTTQKENADLTKRVEELTEAAGAKVTETPASETDAATERLYCPVPGCGAGPYVAKGLKAHMTKMHSDYTPTE